MAEARGKKKRSLVEFHRAKRRAACSVCSLPDAILGELKSAREKKISQDIVMEWLKAEHGITIPRQNFIAHGAAHHEVWANEEAQDV